MLTRRVMVLSGLVMAGCGGAVGQGRGAVPLHMTSPRAAHAIVSLADGSVLFIGGCVAGTCDTGPASATVDRFDAGTGRISAAGRLLGPRTQAGVAALANGQVLIAGGWQGPSITASLERFDPKLGTSQRVGAMSAAQMCQAINLADGRVLLVGEQTLEIFDPATSRVSVLSKQSPYLDGGTATLLSDGRVLVVGGGISREPRADAFLINVRTGAATQTGSLASVRRKHAAVRLLDGRVLIVGGSDARDRNGGKMKAMEVFDPKTGRFSVVGQTQDARYKIVDAAVRLADGRILLTGGADLPEIVDPKTWTSRVVDFSMGSTLNFSTAAALPNGDVLVAGGYSETTIRLTDRVWVIPRAAFA